MFYLKIRLQNCTGAFATAACLLASMVALVSLVRRNDLVDLMHQVGEGFRDVDLRFR